MVSRFVFYVWWSIFIHEGTALRVLLRSEGCDSSNRLGCQRCGWGFILINGYDYSPHERGLNVVVLHNNGSFTTASYDVYGDRQASKKFRNFIDNVVSKGEIVLVVAQDDASKYYSNDLHLALKAIGSSLDSWLEFRQSYALVGKKGSPRPSWVRDKRQGRWESPVVIDAVVPYNGSLVAPQPTIGTPPLYQKVGCFKDPGDIASLEDKDPVLEICFKARTNAVTKCAVAAAKRNFRVFAVKNGGKCLADSTVEIDYKNAGSSDACKDDGEGGPKAIEVYIFQVGTTTTTKMPDVKTTEVTSTATKAPNVTTIEVTFIRAKVPNVTTTAFAEATGTATKVLDVTTTEAIGTTTKVLDVSTTEAIGTATKVLDVTTTEVNDTATKVLDVTTTDSVTVTNETELFPVNVGAAKGNQNSASDEKYANHTLVAWIVPFVVVVLVILLVTSVILFFFLWRRKKRALHTQRTLDHTSLPVAEVQYISAIA